MLSTDDLMAQLPVYRRIELAVREHIAAGRLNAHDRLPSESMLAERHGASIGTVRKALNNLVEAKIIYRRHGQGTFVSPRSRKSRILIIPGRRGLDDAPRDDYTDFVFGALVEAIRSGLPCEPAIADRRDFLANLEDAMMVYPEVAGVILFRGHENVAACRPALERQDIPLLFYGPNFYDEDDAPYSTIHHDEAQVAELLAGRFAERGSRRIAVLTGDDEITRERARRMTAQLDRIGLSREVFGEETTLTPEGLRPLVGSFDVLACAVSRVAIQAVQILERDLGLRVPRDIAVSGMDNTPATGILRPGLTVVDLCNWENGRLALREFSQYIAGGRRRPIRINARLRLVARDSC